LPVVPPAMLLIIGMIFRKREEDRNRTRAAATVIGATLFFSGITFVALSRKIPSGQDIIPATWHAPIFLSLILGGLISVVLARTKRANAALLCSTVTALFALLGAYDGLHWIDPLYSARKSASDVRRLHREFDPSQAAVYRASRGIEFGLNYYLRRELPSWSPGSPPARWVFTPYSGTAELEKQGFKCPRFSVFPAVFLCENAALPDRLGGGRQPR